jgi:hypothetical protein
MTPLAVNSNQSQPEKQSAFMRRHSTHPIDGEDATSQHLRLDGAPVNMLLAIMRVLNKRGDYNSLQCRQQLPIGFRF